MPYAFLHPDGTIKQVVPKPTPFMRVGEGERMVNYNPPIVDDEMYKDKVHELEALTDETVAYCIHALRDKDTNEIFDPSMIPAGVSPLNMAAPVCK